MNEFRLQILPDWFSEAIYYGDEVIRRLRLTYFSTWITPDEFFELLCRSAPSPVRAELHELENSLLRETKEICKDTLLGVWIARKTYLRSLAEESIKLCLAKNEQGK